MRLASASNHFIAIFGLFHKRSSRYRTDHHADGVIGPIERGGRGRRRDAPVDVPPAVDAHAILIGIGRRRSTTPTAESPQQITEEGRRFQHVGRMERRWDATRRLDGLQQLVVGPAGRYGAKFRMDRTEVEQVEVSRIASSGGDVQAGREGRRGVALGCCAAGLLKRSQYPAASAADSARGVMGRLSRRQDLDARPSFRCCAITLTTCRRRSHRNQPPLLVVQHIFQYGHGPAALGQERVGIFLDAVGKPDQDRGGDCSRARAGHGPDCRQRCMCM